MPQETHRPLMTLTGGRHSRLPGVTRLRHACLMILIALVAEFGLGMWLNIYVPVPAADQHAGMGQEITNGPLLLTVHVLVGMFLIGAAIVLLAMAVTMRRTRVTALASAGLGAVLGAFAAGEFFVRDGEPRASLWMAVLTGVAMLCYACLQALAGATRIAPARAPSEAPLLAHPPYRPAAPRPRPADMMTPPAPRRPDPRQAAAMGRRQPGYGRPDSGYRRTASGPQPVYPGNMPRNGVPRQGRPVNTSQSWPPHPAGSGYPEEW